MLFQVNAIHNILYDDRVKKRESLLGTVSVFVKAEDEVNRKLPPTFMIRTIEKLVSTRHCRYVQKLLDEEHFWDFIRYCTCDLTSNQPSRVLYHLLPFTSLTAIK
jgi:hypothetical protein